MKKFWKSVKIWQSYGREFSGLLFFALWDTWKMEKQHPVNWSALVAMEKQLRLFHGNQSRAIDRMFF